MRVKCPTCGKLTEYTPSNAHRPFCGERCRTMDLGAWADEKYRVPTESVQVLESVNGNSRTQSPFEEDRPPKDQLN